MLVMHQDNMCILHKPRPDLYIVDWVSHHNHIEGRGKDIAGMNINIHTVSMAKDIIVYTSVQKIRNAICTDAELQMLQTCIIIGWPQNKDNLETTLQGYWPMGHKLSIIDGVAMK